MKTVQHEKRCNMKRVQKSAPQKKFKMKSLQYEKNKIIKIVQLERTATLR